MFAGWKTRRDIQVKYAISISYQSPEITIKYNPKSARGFVLTLTDIPAAVATKALFNYMF